MATIPYATVNDPGLNALVSAITKRRGGRLLNLDRMLLHSPALARAWNEYLGAIRTGLSLPPRIREFAICGVAILTGADYELKQHLPEFLRAGGAQEQLAVFSSEPGRVHDAGLSATERLVARLVVEMSRQVIVSDGLLPALAAALGEQEAVELVAVVATYNMVSRFLLALQVDDE